MQSLKKSVISQLEKTMPEPLLTTQKAFLWAILLKKKRIQSSWLTCFYTQESRQILVDAQLGHQDTEVQKLTVYDSCIDHWINIIKCFELVYVTNYFWKTTSSHNLLSLQEIHGGQVINPALLSKGVDVMWASNYQLLSRKFTTICHRYWKRNMHLAVSLKQWFFNLMKSKLKQSI